MRGIALICLFVLWVVNVWGHVNGFIVPWLAYGITAVISVLFVVVWRRFR